jgi:nitrous oxidase accessory protein
VGSLTVANSAGVVVENLTLSHSGMAVALAYTNDSLIRDVAFSNNTNGYGISVSSGNNNTVSGCNVSDCFSGVSLAFADNNTVSGNVIRNSDHFGVYLWNALQNTVVQNDVLDSDWTCVYIEYSGNNTFHHNNFVNYSEARVDGLANVWDDDIEGNYWSTYAGADLNLDGIGDTPSVLSANNMDRYPLWACTTATTLTYLFQFQRIITLESFRTRPCLLLAGCS